MNTREDDEGEATTRDEQPSIYEIRIKGHLDNRWAARFDGMNLSRETDGTTIIRGPVADQAALHGALQRVRDLGLQLVSLIRLESD